VVSEASRYTRLRARWTGHGVRAPVAFPSSKSGFGESKSYAELRIRGSPRFRDLPARLTDDLGNMTTGGHPLVGVRRTLRLCFDQKCCDVVRSVKRLTFNAGELWHSLCAASNKDGTVEDGHERARLAGRRGVIVRNALVLIIAFAAAVPASAQVSLVDALVEGRVPSATYFPADDNVERFSIELVSELVPSARARGVRFQRDGAEALLDYLRSDAIAPRLRPTEPQPSRPERVSEQDRFAVFLLSRATSGFVTARTVQEVIAAIEVRESSFCPCWPFC
jgi:hypothetical protein